MPKILTDLHYLPTIPWFTQYMAADTVLLNAAGNYSKQTYRNRTLIRGANRIETLIVPVLHTGQKQKVSEVRIDYSQRWAQQHWRSLASAYGKAPYFTWFADGIEQILLSETETLFELNQKLLTFCLKCLRVPIKHSVYYEWPNSETLQAQGIEDHRIGFHAANIRFEPLVKPYYQLFGPDFVQGLCVLDALFCCGLETLEILKPSTK